MAVAYLVPAVVARENAQAAGCAPSARTLRLRRPREAVKWKPQPAGYVGWGFSEQGLATGKASARLSEL
jgi:hypothetical protein